MIYFFFFLIVLALGSLTVWLFVLMDCINAEFEGNDKILWVLAISFLPGIGCLLYHFIGRRKKVESYSPWDWMSSDD